ncbi:MAG TPA: acyltransferase family protein [Verrucomicrobiae bacterium]
MNLVADTSIKSRGKYRPDVDGLRALAILAVLFYHAKLACPGGFVGVDIFFVISGFLITSLILDEMGEGAFSVVNFWERRIRRILPAAAVLTVATVTIAMCRFLPKDFALVGKSVAYQAVMGGNFFFWQQSGYFAPGAETQPMLHTWSLAVEEQFYVLFPPLLLLLARWGKRAILAGIGILAIVSFASCLCGGDSPSHLQTAFYLLPGRAWELFLGAMLAGFRGKTHLARAAREICGWLGVALIAWPIFLYSPATLFPGIGALPPCSGAALIILSSDTGRSTIGSVLALRPVVFIGLVSYSLYLWHWPLLAFAAYASQDPVPVKARLGLLALSFVLAVISWQWVEKPFRQRRIFRQRPQILGFAGSVLALLLTLGLWANGHGEFSWQARAKPLKTMEAPSVDPQWAQLEKRWQNHLISFKASQTNPAVEVLIWGDSHAMAMAPVLDVLSQEKGWHAMEATDNGTPPVRWGSAPRRSAKEAAAFSESVFKYIVDKRPRKVFLIARWSGYVTVDSFQSNLVATVRSLLPLGIKVYVVKDVPFPGFDAPRFAALTAAKSGDISQLGASLQSYEQKNLEMKGPFDQIAQLGVPVLDPAPYFLNSHGLYGVERNGRILYTDGDHLSVSGAMLLEPLFSPLFQNE